MSTVAGIANALRARWLGRWTEVVRPALFKLALAGTVFGLGIAFAHKQCWPLGDGCLTSRHPLPEVRSYAKNKLWGEKLREGGYILHFRHAEREKWTDVSAFDAIEVATGADGEQTSYRRAICLTERGKEEAKLIGASFKMAGIQVGEIIASPSCRARQTATHAFGRIDAVRNSLLHRVAIVKDQHAEFARDLHELMHRVAPKGRTNVALVGHGGTLDLDKIIDINETDRPLDARDETGFVIIEKQGNKLIARHQYPSIRYFVSATTRIPRDQMGVAADTTQ